MTEVPRIGVGVFVIRPDGHFIIGQRNDKASLGYATYAIPGGHLEMHESFEECAARELLEETGINVPSKQFHFLTAVNTSFYESGKHYATMFMGVVVPEDADPRLLEPNKCSGWSWIDWPAFTSQDRTYFSPLVVLLSDRPGFEPAQWLVDVKTRERMKPITDTSLEK